MEERTTTGVRITPDSKKDPLAEGAGVDCLAQSRVTAIPSFV